MANDVVRVPTHAVPCAPAHYTIIAVGGDAVDGVGEAADSGGATADA